mmetsp:Transcript_135278/g.432478  ORF Transcript_135278/g.432478 Transcript_135278/m.432478 type:complete len:264 (+) Transcript_135278:924-1715(+)
MSLMASSSAIFRRMSSNRRFSLPDEGQATCSSDASASFCSAGAWLSTALPCSPGWLMLPKSRERRFSARTRSECSRSRLALSSSCRLFSASKRSSARGCSVAAKPPESRLATRLAPSTEADGAPAFAVAGPTWLPAMSPHTDAALIGDAPALVLTSLSAKSPDTHLPSRASSPTAPTVPPPLPVGSWTDPCWLSGSGAPTGRSGATALGSGGAAGDASCAVMVWLGGGPQTKMQEGAVMDKSRAQAGIEAPTSDTPPSSAEAV